MNLKSSSPLTVIYRGTLEDTATLVGLAHARANVGMIALTVEPTDELRRYCELVSRWLVGKGLPPILDYSGQDKRELGQVLECPLKDWAWGEDECLAALLLADLPLPPLHLVR
jgi:hypothetical protein